MLEIFCILLVMIFAFGHGHMAFVSGILWFLDEAEGTEMPWNFETFMAAMIVPLGLIITSVELYLLFHSIGM